MEQTEQQTPLDALRPALSEVIKKRVQADIEPEKQRQRIRLQKADLYNRLVQYLEPGVDSVTGEMGWRPLSRGDFGNDGENSGLLDFVLDITAAYRRKYVGVLGLRPFYNVKSMPDDPQSEVDRRAARQAELGALWLRNVWNVRQRNIEILDKQWRFGTPYVYLPFVADKDDFGETEEPEVVSRDVEIEPAGFRCPMCQAKFDQPNVEQVVDEATYEMVDRPICPQCRASIAEHNWEDAQTTQVPEVVGTKTYPNAGPKFILTSGLFVTVPFDCPDIDKSPYLLYEYEEQPGVLLQIFGDDLRRFVNENGEFQGQGTDAPPNDQDEDARHTLFSLGGARVSNSGRWTYSRYWLTPAMYEYVHEKEKRALLYAQFPDGLKISVVEGRIVRLDNEALSDHWIAIPPEPGESVYHDPVCWGILPHQDVTNQLFNIILAYGERGLPTAAIDPDVFDLDIFNQPFRPWEVIPAKPGVGGRLHSSIQSLPTATFPDHLPPVIGMVETNVQNHTGLLPNVTGATGGTNKTADQFRNELNQALQVLGVPGEMIAQGWVKVFTKAMKLIAKYGAGNVVVSVADAMGSTSEMLDIEALRAGKYHFEAEVGVPMSWSERKSALELIIGQNPQLAHAMGLDSPMSIHAIRDFLLPNMPEIRTTLDDVRQKVIETIQILLEQEPIEQRGPDGTPEYMPSIQPEPFVDDHAAEAEIVKQWLNSAPGRKAREQKPAGWRNVVAYGMAQSNLAAPPAPLGPDGQPMPPQESAPPEQQQAA